MKAIRKFLKKIVEYAVIRATYDLLKQLFLDNDGAVTALT